MRDGMDFAVEFLNPEKLPEGSHKLVLEPIDVKIFNWLWRKGGHVTKLKWLLFFLEEEIFQVDEWHNSGCKEKIEELESRKIFESFKEKENGLWFWFIRVHPDLTVTSDTGELYRLPSTK